MDAAWLAEQLEAGRSIESIARETGRSPSTVAYWVHKHALQSQHAAKHASKGGIARDVLEALVAGGLSGPGDRGQARREPGHGAPLAAQARARDGAGKASSGNRQPVERERRRRRHRCLPSSWEHRVPAPSRGRMALSQVPCRSRRGEAPLDQGRARERGRRRMCLVRLCAQHRSTSFPSCRSERKGVPPLPQRRHAVDRRSQGGGRQVHPPVRQLPCGSRGRSRYHPRSCPADQSGVAAIRGSSIWQMRSAVNREVVGSSPTPGATSPASPRMDLGTCWI